MKILRALLLFGTLLAKAAELQVSITTQAASVVAQPVFVGGACFLERTERLGEPFEVAAGKIAEFEIVEFATQPQGGSGYFRAQSFDWNHPQLGFTNFIRSFSTLTTLAGAGGAGNTDNKWQPGFEGGPATNALLSRPHIALGDDAGNIYIADKEGQAIRVVRPNGTIHTHAGTGTNGDGPDDPTPARNVALSQPNGCWVRKDGTVYILDLGNGKVRRVDTNGICVTLFSVPGGISTGRGLWVSDDETLAYLSSGNRVKKWTPAGGVVNIGGTFVDLGNLAVNAAGRLIITDRGAHRAWWVADNGTLTPAAGNGTSTGGGDGSKVLETGLNELRGVWVTPNNGLLLSTAAGSQVWYADPGGVIHLLLSGARSSTTHAGDGAWFYAPDEARISETRSVTMDRQGNILITENDRGYVRRIRFAPKDR